MKGTAVTLEELLSPLRQYFLKDTFVRSDINNTPPLRAELFTLEQVTAHAADLAQHHEITYHSTAELLLKRLAENEEVLKRVVALLQESVRDKTPVTPAGEWLLDNFYHIEEQVQIAKRHLPKDYSKGLPKLSAGTPSAGMPRVYDIAIEIISHNDGHLDLGTLYRFLESYQTVSELTLGELWAVPIMLRLALLENMRRVSARIAIDRIDANLAHHWADNIVKTAEKNPKNLVLILADMARSNPPMNSAFVAEYARKLQWKGINLTLPLTWIEQHLAETGDSINGMVMSENQKQAADHVTMSNSVKSLRFLAQTNWRDFVESMSIVEKTLKTDSAGVYQGMDFHTRDQYRHAVEKLAKKNKVSENDVAKAAVRLCQSAANQNQADALRSHVGYYLIGDGLPVTQKVIRNPKTSSDFRQFISKAAAPFYALGSLAIAAVVSYYLTMEALSEGLHPVALTILLLCILSGAAHFGISISNWLTTLWTTPRSLPKMDFSSGIPDSSRTLVAVPAMITSLKAIDKLVDDLEVRYLGNMNKNLFFALLTDLKDAQLETLPEDNELVQYVSKKIEDLNKKYTHGAGDLFFLFHRPRRWNPADKLWMGYERKRGKLGELNGLLRGRCKDKFTAIVGSQQTYATIRYVITLDSDTQLPRESAARLAGLMAHPLNRPIVDEKKNTVIKGYGIIQPRIAISLQGARRSLFSRMHENDTGIDPYTRVTSDIYQDLFQEGSFIGKGIYDVDVFERILNNAFPENRILSHDLLEGSYVRSGYASDVQLYEEFPSRYMTDSGRRHRWMRGDWQILNWFLPWVPNAARKLSRNPISGPSKWKIFDNLRRSLVPILLFTTLILSWTLLKDPTFWTACVLVILFAPVLSVTGWSVIKKPKEISFSRHLRNISRSTFKSMAQSLYMLICLPYEAYLSLDAVFRTLWRVFISNRKLLEWTPYGFFQGFKENFFTILSSMWFAPVASVAIGVFISKYNPTTLFIAVPFLVLWTLSPVIAFWVSLPIKTKRSRVSAAQRQSMRDLARRTWAFFEEFVNEKENWLPPDNLQQYPIIKIAHRTSPTNIGISLLANLAAYDFGYITSSQLITRCGNTFNTMQKLERHSGHLFNWYDTQTLRVLHPKYISTVDSGNLAGQLLTLRQGLTNLPKEKVLRENFWGALHDTIHILGSEVLPTEKEYFIELKKEFETVTFCRPVQIRNLRENLTLIDSALKKFVSQSNVASNIIAFEWVGSLEEQIQSFRQEILMLEPLAMMESVPEKFNILRFYTDIPSLAEVANLEQDLDRLLPEVKKIEKTSEESRWLMDYERSLRQVSQMARLRIIDINKLIAECLDFSTMEYEFLYDKSLHLLSIGYNADDFRRDAGFYDLLASEARLAIFVAIAQGKIAQESWFALGRSLTAAEGTPVLLSWSGSMFEYLMPNLVMPSYENTLLDETCKGAVKKQIEYGRERGVPWGVSESCYNMVDASLSYQYRAFGIPDLGYKRGLGLDLVIAPYATVLAVMVDPVAACKNMDKLRVRGYEGKYGFFESIDYTPLRLTRNKIPALIQSFMAHHQGMSLLALHYVLCDQLMQKRFEADPNLQTALLLLQERVPKAIGYNTLTKDSEDAVHAQANANFRVLHSPNTPHPEVQLLSNGSYHVMINNAGSGYSRLKDMAITRWREDTTCDNWGTFCYIRDLQNGEFWSNTYQPTLKEAEHYEAIFSQGRAEYRRNDNGIDIHTEIVVSPEDHVEIRRLRITNRTRASRKIEVTSFGEVVIALPTADEAHPAFSNLFVQTEIVANQHAILCTRRARSNDENPPWIFHLMKLDEGMAENISYETDRFKFVGRGNSVASPCAMAQSGPLSNSQGPVLDPVISIQYRLNIRSEETTIVDVVTGYGDNRGTCQTLVDKYQDRNFRNRAFELTWTHSQVVLRQINATEADAQLFSRIASSVIYTNPTLRAGSEILVRNNKGQSALWSHSISGDLPIVLLQVSDSTNLTIIQQLLQARAYWLFKGLIVDLIIINEDYSGYRQVLQDQIQSLIAAGISINPTDKQGNIVIKLTDQISTEDRVLLQSVARVIISDKNGSLLDHLNRKSLPLSTIPFLVQSKPMEVAPEAPFVRVQDLQFYNGLGGFSPDGNEYVISPEKRESTPLPWSNVIANPNFGTVVTESGPSYTWSENAHEFRLTPWNNDPITNSCGEAFYLRDEESGHFWSPTAYPAKGKSQYTTRHGFGYTVFEHQENGIHSELWIYVDREAQIRFSVLKVRNLSGRSRTLTATGYSEWVLGSLRATSAMHIVTELDPVSGTLITRNPYNSEFPNRVAFMGVDSVKFNFTTDRGEFIGRNGTLAKPEGMKRLKLSGKQGAGLDPCSAIQVPFVLSNGQEREIIFKMGAAKDAFEVNKIISKFNGRDAVVESLHVVREFWRTTLGSIKVKTPDSTINLLSNGWLLYQVISCRLWGRTGFYQSGGAFGFRDQLQDTIALMHTTPWLTREQIILSASRQFKEGDVQHWWHPPQGRGVRTACSDDLLWLPYTTSRYVVHTQDYGILQESIHFIEGRLLNANEESTYDMPIFSDQKSNLYDHCKRAIAKSLRFGTHGMPLMGSGDWNDGMNKVGIHGQGESVWLAFFFYDVLKRFEVIADRMNDEAFAETCRKHAEDLKRNIDDHGWDGAWYRRAYFDDGSPLGSSENVECKIDSLSQSWAVLSGAGNIERTYQAMESVDMYLVDRRNALIRLLDPPFDKSEKDPGYIKGYLPGVRENGGQYSHAAIWMVMATAKLGNNKRTFDLLSLINPVNHGKTRKDIDVYKAEPYVIAADVYGVAPHVGRGGWTWYTGSAGWMYQLLIESFLGLKREGNLLFFKPCVPETWEFFEVDYRYINTTYHIKVVVTKQEPASVKVDGLLQSEGFVMLVDDSKVHQAEIIISANKVVKADAVMEMMK